MSAFDPDLAGPFGCFY